MDVLLDQAQLGPEGQVRQRLVEAELRLDDGAEKESRFNALISFQ